MSTTLWIATLEGRTMDSDSDDHSVSYALADQLDAACAQLGVPAFSSYFDTTDAEMCLSDEFDGDDEAEPDPETGYAYGIDDMQWFDAASGRQTLQALRQHIAGSGGDWAGDERDALLEELDDFIARLEAPAAHGGKFHLALVM